MNASETIVSCQVIFHLNSDVPCSLFDCSQMVLSSKSSSVLGKRLVSSFSACVFKNLCHVKQYPMKSDLSASVTWAAWWEIELYPRKMELWTMHMWLAPLVNRSCWKNVRFGSWCQKKTAPAFLVVKIGVLINARGLSAHGFEEVALVSIPNGTDEQSKTSNSSIRGI